ncbi:MAG: hypothetical protein ACKO96_00720, partial [Flammeovirgaceae bacterium]
MTSREGQGQDEDYSYCSCNQLELFIVENGCLISFWEIVSFVPLIPFLPFCFVGIFIYCCLCLLLLGNFSF